MIATAALEQWLRDNGLPADVAVSLDGQIPDMPDRIAVLTRTGGPGAVRERSYEIGAVQVICRDGQGAPSAAAAESLAGLVDDIRMGAVGPLEIGGLRVISIEQEGGPPAFLDRDDAERVLYVCSYLFEVARAVN